MRFLVVALCLLAGAGTRSAAETASWVPLWGPTGGDVRSLAADPRSPDTVYLGTSDGVLYRSDDGGERWHRLSPGFPVRGASLDDLIVDPRGRILVGYWNVAGGGGGVARSLDGGQTFDVLAGLTGQTVKGLALAPSNPDIVVAGTLTGVFGSGDAGDTWSRISPEGHPELKNVGSVAVDPKDPQTLYAGTWHLPWKTVDGGRVWRPIRSGMINDSDVMTFAFDHRNPEVVYATACSGIYRSINSARRWSKIPGIPYSSRRTRAFAQDPARARLFFAGTTEGLWRSRDGARSWTRVTPKNLVVNAVALLPGGRVLAGTDGAGVLRSTDLGQTWAPSNRGFVERFVSQILFADDGQVVLGLLGDRHHSGVLSAPRAAGPWSKVGPGLEGRELLSLVIVPDEGTGASLADSLLAGTDQGLFRLREGAWTRQSTVVDGLDEKPRVAAVAAVSTNTFLVATPRGLLHTTDGGHTWVRRSLGLASNVTAVASARGTSLAVAATPLGLFMSRDAGASWKRGSLLPVPETVDRLAFLPGRPQIILGTTVRGLVLSRNGGRTWRVRGGGLPQSQISGLALHPDGRRLWASDFSRGGLYTSTDGGLTWKPFTTAGLLSDRVWALAADPGTGRLLAAPPSGGLHALIRRGSSASAVAASP